MKGITSNIIINPKEVITIFNILRDLGLNTSHNGTKYINKAIQLLITSNNDIVVFEDIYKSIADYYNNITSKQVKNAITYTLNNRLETKTIKNFNKIFGFEYDDYYFTNKTIIEEITRILKVNNVF